MTQRWFHKEDGGLIIWRKPSKKEVAAKGVYFMRCSICGEPWWYADDAVSYNDLPEDLQAMALSEML